MRDFLDSFLDSFIAVLWYLLVTILAIGPLTVSAILGVCFSWWFLLLLLLYIINIPHILAIVEHFLE